ncbi:MAG: LysE family translocator [Pseudomonadota bacterium]
MTIETWLAFAVASGVLLATPGPTVLLVVSYAFNHGWRSALPSVAGVALGDLVAMSVSLIGLGALLAASAELYTLLRWIGAAYLVYLGIQLWRARSDGLAARGDAGPADGAKMLRTTFLVTVLNPKGIVFFVAFVPQFVDPAAAYAPQALLMMATFVGLAVLNAAIYAAIATHARGAVQRPAVQRAVNRVSGSILIGAGVYTASLRS